MRGNIFPRMVTGISHSIQASLARLLKPLVRLLLRYGVSYGVFADIAKRIYVEVAMEEFRIPGRKPTLSRASVITGLTRKEVQRVTRLAPLSDAAIQERYNRAVRVVTGWSRDPAFLDAEGSPRALPLEGAVGSFEALVRAYSGDMPMRPVLDELLRVGALQRLDDGRVQLRGSVYVPEGDLENKITILGTDVADLIGTIDHNLSHSGRDSRFQLKVAYDNLPAGALVDFRDSSSQRAFRLLKTMDAELSQLDRDANPQAVGTGRVRAGVSIYYFEEDLAAAPAAGEG
jgi:Family of unknown function (DUF6502)